MDCRECTNDSYHWVTQLIIVVTFPVFLYHGYIKQVTHVSNEPKLSTRPIAVDENITPITQQPVETVSATDWGNRSIAQLQDELVTLFNRKNMLISMGRNDMVPFIEGGIATIQAIITHKYNAQGQKNLEGKKPNDPLTII